MGEGWAAHWRRAAQLANKNEQAPWIFAIFDGDPELLRARCWPIVRRQFGRAAVAGRFATVLPDSRSGGMRAGPQKDAGAKCCWLPPERPASGLGVCTCDHRRHIGGPRYRIGRGRRRRWQYKAARSDIRAGKKTAESADIFKFNIKNIISAEITSKSQYLIWTMLAVFVVFAAVVIFSVQAVSQHPKRTWIVGATGVVVAGIVTHLILQRMLPPTPPAQAVNRIAELLVTQASTTAAAGDGNGSALAPYLQQQFSAIRTELSEARQQIALQGDELSRFSSGASFGQAALLGIVPVAMLLAVACATALAFLAMRSGMPLIPRRKFPRRAEGAPPDTQADRPVAGCLPLSAIYRLEDLLLRLRISSGWRARSPVEERPALDVNELLGALNSVRRQIEDGPGVDDLAVGETRLSAVRYELLERISTEEFDKLNRALSALDDALSARYERDPPDWRAVLMRALVQARRVLIANSMPVHDPG